MSKKPLWVTAWRLIISNCVWTHMCARTHSYELVLLIISKSSGCFDMVSASHLFGCNIIYIDSSANWYTY